MKHKNIPLTFLKKPNHFLAFGFGSGLLPKAPGTYGTLAAIPVYLIIQELPLESYLLFITISAILGIWLCSTASKALQLHDHPGIVWDEFVGFWITMIAAPPGWLWIAVGFILFRLFDIWKPWPIRVLDRHIHGGLGIMLDDIVAGIFACIALHSIYWITITF